MRLAQILGLTISVGCATVVVAADNTVSGTFTVDDDTLEPHHVVVVWQEPAAADTERALDVILAAEPVATEGWQDALDPAEAITDGIDGDYLKLTVSADGTLGSVYAFFAESYRNVSISGRGQAAMETMTADHAAGRVFTDGEEDFLGGRLVFDLTFDATVLPERPSGDALPADGGDPGAAYLAYVTACRERSFDDLLRYLDRERAGWLADTDEEWRDMELDSFQESAPQEMTVVGGESFDGYAILSVEGKDVDGGDIVGKIKMVLDDGEWRYAEELITYVW